MKEELEKAIKDAAEKSQSAESAHEAMQYTQAALNAAHVLAIISSIV